MRIACSAGRGPGAGLDFLGYTFRYQQDRYGRERRYLHLTARRSSRDGRTANDP